MASLTAQLGWNQTFCPFLNSLSWTTTLFHICSSILKYQVKYFFFYFFLFVLLSLHPFLYFLYFHLLLLCVLFHLIPPLYFHTILPNPSVSPPFNLSSPLSIFPQGETVHRDGERDRQRGEMSGRSQPKVSGQLPRVTPALQQPQPQSQQLPALPHRYSPTLFTSSTVWKLHLSLGKGEKYFFLSLTWAQI